MRKARLFVTLVLFGWLGTAMPAPAFAGDQVPAWRYVHLSASAPAVPIRIVGPEEPWEHVVQDIQARVSPSIAGRAMRAGFYGHGAFTKPSEVLSAIPFVAALGEAAAMDVMVGRVTDVHFTVSHRQPKLVAIDKQPNDDVMHLDRSGKARLQRI